MSMTTAAVAVQLLLVSASAAAVDHELNPLSAMQSAGGFVIQPLVNGDVEASVAEEPHMTCQHLEDAHAWFCNGNLPQTPLKSPNVCFDIHKALRGACTDAGAAQLAEAGLSSPKQGADNSTEKAGAAHSSAGTNHTADTLESPDDGDVSHNATSNMSGVNGSSNTTNTEDITNKDGFNVTRYTQNMLHLHKSQQLELAVWRRKVRRLEADQARENAAMETRHRADINDLKKKAQQLSIEHAEELTALTSEGIAVGSPLTRAITESIKAKHAAEDAEAAVLTAFTMAPPQAVPASVSKAADDVKAANEEAASEEQQAKTMKAKVMRQQLREAKAADFRQQAKLQEEKASEIAKTLPQAKKDLAKEAYNALVDKLRKEEQAAADLRADLNSTLKKMERREGGFDKLQKQAEQMGKKAKASMEYAEQKADQVAKLTEAYPEKQFEALPPMKSKTLSPSQDDQAETPSVEDLISSTFDDVGDIAEPNVNPQIAFQQPIEGERPTFDDAKERLVPAATMETTVIAGEAYFCMSNIPEDERNQCSKVFAEREQKGEAKCSGKVPVNGKQLSVWKACAKSCVEEEMKAGGNPEQAMEKEKGIKIKENEELVKKAAKKAEEVSGKLDRANRQLSAKIAAKDKELGESHTNSTGTTSNQTKQKDSNAPGTEDQKPAVESQDAAAAPGGPASAGSSLSKSELRDKIESLKGQLAAITTEQAKLDASIKKEEDTLEQEATDSAEQAAQKLIGKTKRLQDHFELAFPLAPFEKRGQSRQEAHLPIRDDGIGRLMRFNRVFTGKRSPHLLFIDEHTRVLYQIDATTGRVVQLIDFWKHGYLQKFGDRHGTPMEQRLPCPVPNRLKIDRDNEGFTQKSYDLTKKHRCLAMNPHVIAQKRDGLEGKWHHKETRHESDARGQWLGLLYNDMSERELGFAFTGLAVPGDIPKGGELEPHHNTWRVPGALEDDKMYFYAAQGMVTSSMAFGCSLRRRDPAVHGHKRWHNHCPHGGDGWQRHNHPRLEILEYEIDTPIDAIRTFPVFGIPNFFPQLPGPEEAEGHQSLDWASPVGELVKRASRPDVRYHKGQLAKVMRWLKQERWEQLTLSKRMDCGAEGKPQPWHVVQAQHDCTHQFIFDRVSGFQYPRQFVDCYQIVNPLHDSHCHHLVRHGGRRRWHHHYATRCNPPQPTCEQRNVEVNVWRPITGRNRQVRGPKEKVVAKMRLEKACAFTCEQEKIHKTFNQYKITYERQAGYTWTDGLAAKIRKRRLLELVMNRDGRRPTEAEQNEHASINDAVAKGGAFGKRMDAKHDEFRVTLPKGGFVPWRASWHHETDIGWHHGHHHHGHHRRRFKSGYEHVRAGNIQTSNHGMKIHAFNEYFKQNMVKFYNCLNEEKKSMKVDAAVSDEFQRLMRSDGYNREYLAPKDGTGGAEYLAVWKDCSIQRSKLSTEDYIQRINKEHNILLGDEKDEEKTADGKEAYTPEQKKVREKNEKKRRAQLVKDAMIKQEIMEELDAKKEKEIIAKSTKFDSQTAMEKKEQEQFFDCQIQKELQIAKKCYDRLMQGRGDPKYKHTLSGHWRDPNRMNVADRPFVKDFVAAHEKCTAVRAEYRRWECKRMFSTDGPGVHCRKRDPPNCAKLGTCGRTYDCAAQQTYPIRRDWDDIDQRLNVDEGQFPCKSVCGTIDASFPHGAEREGYVHNTPHTWHREGWLPNQLYPNTTSRARGDLPMRMIGFDPGGKEYASGGDGSYGGNQYRYPHCGRHHHACNNKGTWGDESIKFWTTVKNANMKLQLLNDNIAKARRGIILNELWMPYHKTRDKRGVPTKQELRRVNVLESVAVPASGGVFTAQLWLAMTGMSAYHGKAQGTEEEDVPTWAGSGMGQCPPFGVETKIYVAEVPSFRDCASRCDLIFRDIEFTPGTPIAPNKNSVFARRNPDLYNKLDKRYQLLKKDWAKITQIPSKRTHDDSPFMLKKFSHKHQTGAYGGVGRRRCYGGAGYRKTHIVAMTFDVVSATEKHLFLMDTCGRIISAVVAGALGKEQLVYQQELAGVKCRERALHGGGSFDGVGTDAAFTTFYGRWYSGAGLSIYTDKVTDQKYMAVAEGWKSKLRSVKLGRRVLANPPPGHYLNPRKPKPGNPLGLPELGETGAGYSYAWNTPKPKVEDANVITLTPMVAPRKLAAGEDDNLYVVTNAAMIWDSDLKPQVGCGDMRKVFSTVMKNNPKNWWKHHFGFDKWMPTKDDDSHHICEVTNECHGQNTYGQPVCDCDGEKKEAAVVCKQHEWATCSREACAELGCKSTALRGKAKEKWAKKWWKDLDNEAKVNYHRGWEHFPVRKLRKTLRYCLIRKAAKMPSKDVVNEKSSPEKQSKEVEKKAAKFEQRQAEVHEECGKEYGSWWKLELLKQVQMIRHMCGPPGPKSNGQPTPGKNCPVVYMIKMTTCNSQEARPEQTPLCCVDKSISSFLSPRMGGNKKLDLPEDLHAAAMDKLKLF